MPIDTIYKSDQLPSTVDILHNRRYAGWLCKTFAEKKPARPKKWHALLLLAAIFSWILLVPTGKSFFNSSVNRCTAWWHEFTLYDPIYTVRRGDYLSKIDQKYGIPMQAIVSANKERYPSLVKKPECIEAGWRLRWSPC